MILLCIISANNKVVLKLKETVPNIWKDTNTILELELKTVYYFSEVTWALEQSWNKLQ